MCVWQDFVALLILTLIHHQVRDRRLLKEGDNQSNILLLHQQTSSEKVRKHREELIKFAKSLRNVEPDARSSFSILAHGSNQYVLCSSVLEPCFDETGSSPDFRTPGSGSWEPDFVLMTKRSKS